MRDGWIRPSGIFHKSDVLTNRVMRFEGGEIARIASLDEVPADAEIVQLEGILSPGFVDLQVNGGGGVQLNNTPTQEGVLAIARAHRASGTAMTLPTVITDKTEVTRRAAEAVLACKGLEGVAGIHIEGPHINPARKGTHDPALIRPLDDETFNLVSMLRTHKLPVMITLAPELAEPGQIAALTRMGAIVSAGHSDATADQIEMAFGEGLAAFTHLFNGMRQMTGREPGVVGAALASDAYCGIILDGHHVDDRMSRIAFSSRISSGKMFLVSDAMATWNGPGSFELYGETIRVEQGRLVNREGSLAGAHIDMSGCVIHALEIGLKKEEALISAITAPAALMGLGIEPAHTLGQRAGDVLLMSN